MRCPHRDQCDTPNESGTGPIYMRRYCEHDCGSCARYRLAEVWPMEQIPRWLRPTMMVHAEALLRESRAGLKELPVSMPEMI